MVCPRSHERDIQMQSGNLRLFERAVAENGYHDPLQNVATDHDEVFLVAENVVVEYIYISRAFARRSCGTTKGRTHTGVKQ